MDKKLENLNSHFPNARIMDGTLAKLSGSDIKVYLVIAMHKDFNTGLSYPGYKTITKYTGITSAKRIKQHVDVLIAHNLISSSELTPQKHKDGQTGIQENRRYKMT